MPNGSPMILSKSRRTDLRLANGIRRSPPETVCGRFKGRRRRGTQLGVSQAPATWRGDAGAVAVGTNTTHPARPHPRTPTEKPGRVVLDLKSLDHHDARTDDFDHDERGAGKHRARCPSQRRVASNLRVPVYADSGDTAP
jgi:hypothetical protein